MMLMLIMPMCNSPLSPMAVILHAVNETPPTDEGIGHTLLFIILHPSRVFLCPEAPHNWVPVNDCRKTFTVVSAEGPSHTW